MPMHIDPLTTWVRERFPFDAATPIPDNPPDDLPSLELAAINVARALQQMDAGEGGEQVVFRLGAGLNGIGSHMVSNGDHEAATDIFRVAYTLLASTHARADQPEHFRKAISYAFGNLKRLGVDVVQPLTDAPAGPTPLLALDHHLLGVVDRSAVAMSEATEHADLPVSAAPRYPVQAKRTKESLLAELSSNWSADRLDATASAAKLLVYLDDQLGRSGILARDLGPLLRGDLDQVVDYLASAGLPANRLQLQDAAQKFRTFAFQAGPNEQERRVRWLVACITNLNLWQSPAGLPTNEPQLQIDLMGYLVAIMMGRRYFDADRDLLLDCAEAHVRLAANLTPVVLGRFAYLREWLLASVGTYLLLAGPDPSAPSDSYYDERIHSDDAPAGRGLQRAEREEWPDILLRRWQPDGERAEGAAYAIASLCGWDLSRAHWLVRLVFAGPREARELEEEFWLDRLEGLMTRFARVRVATNPWSEDREGVRGRESMITSDSSGRLVIPDSVLRAAASQGLRFDDAVTVHGQLFAGRRVPTYLLTQRFGPFAILKIDHREKVIREVANFSAFARRLHQSNRPSECYAHPMDMYLGEDGAPLRAIQTSYVFDEDDEPLTMGAWIAAASASVAVETLERFLLVSLRPWLAHVRRDRVDLRLDYPVFRPTPVPGKQSPTSWCRVELQRLALGVEFDPIGLALTSEHRDINRWNGLLPDLSIILDACGLSADQAVNPLWLAAEIGEIGSGELAWLVNSLSVGLRDFDTLLALTHGDLHLENVLCTGAGDPRPKSVLIDFESAHYGHVCKDLARLEASVLCQMAEWTSDERVTVAQWFGKNLSPESWTSEEWTPVDGTRRTDVATQVAARLREIAHGCGQGHWALSWEEYQFALLGTLLPMARYATLPRTNREYALGLATALGSHLLAEWTEQRSTGKWSRM